MISGAQMFTSHMRRLARKQIRNLGFQRTIAPTVADVARSKEIDLVLDVGANDGDFARDLRDAGYPGRIVSFEPASAAYDRLTNAAKNDPKWDTIQLAIGDTDGLLQLSISAIDVYSSFKQPSLAGRVAPGACEIRTEEVPVSRLDTFLRQFPQYDGRTYLKIDTQGFEMEVLRGAGDCLSNLIAVQAELGLVRLYEDQEDWLTVIEWMRNRRFEVATMICNSVDPAAGQAVEYDVVFTNRSENVSGPRTKSVR